jgi:hypothetical protein
MIEATRRVRRLHLTGPDRAALGRAQHTLLDALRTATFPGEDERRILVIRYLDLGDVADGIAPASLALHIERTLAKLASSAVAWDAPGAAESPAVVFPDAIEPLVALAGLVAAGRRPDAWFWKAAVPRFAPELPPVEALRRLIRLALETPVGPVAAARVVAACVASPAGEALLGGLSAEDGAVLAAAFGLGSAPHAQLAERAGERAEQQEAQRPAQRWTAAQLPPRFAAALSRWAPRWGRRDARARWLAAAALLAERPDRAGTALAALADAAVAAALGALPIAAPAPPRPPALPTFAAPLVRASEPPAPAASNSPPGEAPLPQVDEARPRGEHEAAPPAATARRDAAAPAAPEAAAAPPPEASAPRRAAGVEPDARATAHGGLFFLIAVLHRLGIAGFLDEHPALAEAALPMRILARAADRAGAPPDDAVRAALDVGDAPPARGPFVVPATWFEGLLDAPELGVRRGAIEDAGGWILASWSGRAPARARARLAGIRLSRARRPGVEPDPVDTWLTAVERWLARFTELDLAGVIQRRGVITLTRTHLDVDFALRDADVRVRRPGLDVDPGFVRWFGRVVAYHYGRGRG